MSHPFALNRIHHAAYRCRDAGDTVAWYQRVLGMRYTNAFAEDHVPSTGAYDPYMHVFLDCGGGNVLAFFELPNQPEMGRDPNTPEWVQHIAFEVADLDALAAAKAHIEAQGSKCRADLSRHFPLVFSSTPMATGRAGVQHRHGRNMPSLNAWRH
jgi:catechol 2,3-dioxygenase-like lactoylglutathione lyase family enzyme